MMFVKWVGIEYLVWASENPRARAGSQCVAESRVAHREVAESVCNVWLEPHQPLPIARSSATDRAARPQDQGPPSPPRPRPSDHFDPGCMNQEGRKFPRILDDQAFSGHLLN